MGNVLKSLCSRCCRPETQEGSEYLGPHGVTASNVGVSAFARDLFNFDITSQVPEELSQHVVSSKKAQANWFRKLSAAWKESKPPPKTPEDAATLIVQTLKRHQKADVEGLLAFYGLSPPPPPHRLFETSSVPTPWPEGAKIRLQTLPVAAKNVGDGDTITVYVDTNDSSESSIVPKEVEKAAKERSKARAIKDYSKADVLHKKIIDAGYSVITGVNGEDVLARKFRIRLRGIDAPENAMTFGKESREELTKLVEGKCLQVYVYEEDQYGRLVGDIYCDGIFVQEWMLRKGLAWHYVAYDKRPQLAMWEQEARHRRLGLWASTNPEKPWEWRKEHRRGVRVM